MTRSLTLPLRLVSEANVRHHWAARAKRVKSQRQTVAYAWLVAQMPRDRKPANVLLTRYAPRKLDTDNLAGACKAVRDEIALLCGFDDRDESVRWQYAQERAKGYAVRCEIEWAP